MPLERHFTWSMVHKWRGDDWDREGYWTDEKMLDELRNLKEHLPTIMNGKKITLVEAIKMIQKDERISVKIGKVTQITDFSKFANVLESWKHLRTTCNHYHQVWVAQDESYTECEFKRKCNSHNTACKDFESMIKVTPIEELAKGLPFVFR